VRAAGVEAPVVQLGGDGTNALVGLVGFQNDREEEIHR